MRILTVGNASFRETVADALGQTHGAVDAVPTTEAAVASLGDPRSAPHVVVIGPDVGPPEGLEAADRIATGAPSTVLVMVRYSIMNGILPEAMRAGVRDVVDLSRGPTELSDALQRAVSWSKALSGSRDDSSSADGGAPGRVFTVFSSKGGTGKTFLATNLATAIARRSSRETALVDIDLSMGDSFAHFGKEPKTTAKDILSIGNGHPTAQWRALGVPLDDNLWGFGGVADPTPSTVPGPAVEKLIAAVRDEFAYTVVDVPGEYSDAILAALDSADVILLLAALDVVGIRHLATALQTLTSINIPREQFRVVLNRADSKVGIEVADIERVLQVEIDAFIPSSRLVPESLNQGRPLCSAQPSSDVAQSIDSLITRLVPELDAGKAPKHRKPRFRRARAGAR